MPNDNKVSVHHLLILLLFMIPCVQGHRILYVNPIEPLEPPCQCPPHEMCETLDFYANNIMKLPDTNLTLKFLCGNHTLNSNTSTSKVSDLLSLTIQGYHSDPNHVVIQNINMEFQSVPELHLEDITIMDVNFKVYPASMNEHVTFHMKNTKFIRSDSLIIDANLTIQDSSIVDSSNTAFHLIQTNITLMGNVIFMGNVGEKGGALGLISTELNVFRGANITFSNNTAISKGGAIFVDNPTEIFKVIPDSNCFYNLLNYDENATYSITFRNNSAANGGHHIFGASLKSNCTAATSDFGKVHSYEVVKNSRVFHFENPDLLDNFVTSAITASPARVCICDKNGVSQCLDPSKIFVFNYTHYPGELFTIPGVLVGADFGPTIGIVHTRLLSDDKSQPLSFLKNDQKGELLMTTNCSNLNYTIYTQHYGIHLLSLTAVKSNGIVQLGDHGQMNETYYQMNTAISNYHDKGVIESTLLFTPIYIHVNIIPCPLGFRLSPSSSGCVLYGSLRTANKQLKSFLSNTAGYISYPTSWIGAHSELLNKSNHGEVILSTYCLPSLCDENWLRQPVDLQNKSSIDAQCAFNHSGRVCGGCKEKHSLAIGSSHCIECPNNNGVLLLIVFALLGILLVFFVAALDITVTQGMVNGVVFYANIIWMYEDDLFPPQSTGVLLLLRIFIAWLNLDFGIETCFVVGLDAFRKTLLQYVFPLYLWSIVAVIILAARCSSKLTKFLGPKVVPVLSSLVLLSYMKLLRIAVTSMRYAHLNYYSEKGIRTVVVWVEDGRLDYFGAKHSILFAIALVMLGLCLPYTLVLLFGQWLRKLPFFSRFHPIFDSYYAPIKANHHYWLGLVLLTRALLYLLNIFLYPDQSTYALLIIIVLLFTYMSLIRPFQTTANFIFYSTFLVNLIILGGGVLFIHSRGSDQNAKDKLTIASMAVAFMEFCVFVIVRSVKSFPLSWFRSYFCRSKYVNIDDDIIVSGIRDNVAPIQNHEKLPTTSYSTYRDSILEELSLSHVLED